MFSAACWAIFKIGSTLAATIILAAAKKRREGVS